jgi:hypothetical protein
VNRPSVISKLDPSLSEYAFCHGDRRETGPSVWRYLLHDRHTKYTQSFCAIIASGQVEPLVLPARSLKLNACAEAA